MSMDPEERSKLILSKDFSKLSLGSHELAIWAFKTYLTYKPRQGEANILTGEAYDELGDGPNALRHIRKAEHLFTRQRKVDKAVEAHERLKALYKKYDLKPEQLAYARSR